MAERKGTKLRDPRQPQTSNSVGAPDLRGWRVMTFSFRGCPVDGTRVAREPRTSLAAPRPLPGRRRHHSHQRAEGGEALVPGLAAVEADEDLGGDHGQPVEAEDVVELDVAHVAARALDRKSTR